MSNFWYLLIIILIIIIAVLVSVTVMQLWKKVFGGGFDNETAGLLNNLMIKKDMPSLMNKLNEIGEGDNAMAMVKTDNNGNTPLHIAAKKKLQRYCKEFNTD